jgi:hypothetical protein
MAALNQRSSVFISGSNRLISRSKQAATAIFCTAIPFCVLSDRRASILRFVQHPASAEPNNPQLQRGFRCIGPES